MKILGILVASFWIVACGSSQPPVESAVQPQPVASEPAAAGEHGGMMSHGGMMDHEQHCPMAVPNTVGHAAEVEGGASLTFTTTGDVSELRRRVAAMAEKHNHKHPTSSPASSSIGAAGSAEAPAADSPMMMECSMPPSAARAEEVEGGARLILIPADASQLPALREHVRKHGEMMAQGKCPMMHERQPQHEHQATPVSSQPAL